VTEGQLYGYETERCGFVYGINYTDGTYDGDYESNYDTNETDHYTAHAYVPVSAYWGVDEGEHPPAVLINLPPG